MAQGDWTREQHILAFNLYQKIEFGQIKYSFPPIIALANLIGRTADAVAMKLANFARLDPALQARNVKGLSRGAKGEEAVWKEFYNDWESLGWESERLLAQYKNQPVEQIADIETADLPKEGKEREALVKVRVNQSLFRKTILASYGSACCITGINVPEVLVAGHIIPWAEDEKNRMSPHNGLCLNALHDKAFEAGLLSITPKYEIKIAPSLLKVAKKDISVAEYFGRYENASLILPKRFLPDPLFLEQHYENRFQR